MTGILHNDTAIKDQVIVANIHSNYDMVGSVGVIVNKERDVIFEIRKIHADVERRTAPAPDNIRHIKEDGVYYDLEVVSIKPKSLEKYLQQAKEENAALAVIPTLGEERRAVMDEPVVNYLEKHVLNNAMPVSLRRRSDGGLPPTGRRY